MKTSTELATRSVQRHMVLILAVGFSVAFILADRPLLPPKYSYDDQKIAALARQEPGVPTDQSFQITADIYRFLGLADQPLIAGLLGFTFFGGLLVYGLRNRQQPPLTFLKVGLIVTAVFLGAIYLGYYAKELFVLPIAAAVLARIKGKLWDVVIVGCMIVYAIYFRSYWFIVCVFYIGFRWLLSRYTPIRSLAIGALIGLSMLSVYFTFVLNLDLDHYRLSANDARVDNIDAQSAIIPLTSIGGVFGGLLNALAVLLSFGLPVPLLIKGQLIYLLIVLFCLFLWLMLFRSLDGVWKHKLTAGIPEWIPRAAATLFAFTVVQSIFEPDYGSYIRHLSPLLPLMLGIVMTHSREGIEPRRGFGP